jgi:hypothetical protein
MYKPFKIFLFVVILLFTWQSMLAQSNVGIRLMALGIFPEGSENVDHFQHNLDTAGKVHFLPGVIVQYEMVADGRVSVKALQSFFQNRAGELSGFTHLGLRAYVINRGSHALILGIGPSLFYRRDWNRYEWYQNDDEYKIKSSWQYKASILSGEIQYSYFINKQSDISFSINHFEPKGITFGIGYTHWFGANPKGRKPCKSCPSFR